MSNCKICGLSKADHHEFIPDKTMPAGCVCDPGTWDDIIPKPCECYKGNGSEYCEDCSHDPACHGTVDPANE